MRCAQGRSTGFASGSPGTASRFTRASAPSWRPRQRIWPLSPEKVLGCRLEWAGAASAAAGGVAAGRCTARRMWCEQPENHADLAKLLSQPRYVGAPAELLRKDLDSCLVLKPGSPATRIADFYVPAGRSATFPWVSHALWFYSQMVRWRQVEYSPEHVAAAARHLSSRSVSSGAQLARSRYSRCGHEVRSLLRRDRL